MKISCMLVFVEKVVYTWCFSEKIKTELLFSKRHLSFYIVVIDL